MADEDRGNDKPSLELPSLRLGRKKKRPREETAPSAPAEGAAPEETRPIQPVPDVSAEPAPEAATPPPVASEPVPSPDAPPLFVDEAATSPLAPPMTAVTATTAPAVTSGEEAEPAARPEKAGRPRVRREWSLPALGGMTAAMITGVLVGVFTVGLVWASVHLCEVVRGTSSCGGPGYLMLLAIVVAMVLLGAVLLRAWGLPDPSATSFLAVGLMGVLALLMVDLLFNWWMIIVIPAITAATFALSHRITAAFTEPAER